MIVWKWQLVFQRTYQFNFCLLTMKKLNAIVIGSGVGGLATAIRLAKKGIKVDSSPLKLRPVLNLNSSICLK